MRKESRSQKAFLNTIMGFADEFVALICGLILPRLIMTTFGSAYNGITSSISQFISVIALMKAGIGGVTRVALYKPLAEHDYKGISAIVIQTERFMRKIALIFVAFAIIFSVIYPIWINRDFTWLFSFSLILIISMSTFAQYYFGLTYKMVLIADQKQSVTFVFDIIGKVINTIVAVFIILLGGTIHLVKLGSSIVFVIMPIAVSLYTKKKYHIDKTVEAKGDLIKQRWDAVGHEVANFVNNNTGIMVLTVFAGLLEVSVYTVYSFVIVSIRRVVTNFITGFGAAFGNMYVKNEVELMHSNLALYELIVFSIASVLYSVTLVMITSFAGIYTHGVHDVNYIRPVFGIIFTIAGAFSCFRIPYETVVKAVGHYKQTRNGAFAEAIINIVVSLIFVIHYGLVGVAIGSLCAAVFRTFQYAIYLGRNILKRSLSIFLKHLVVFLCISLTTVLISKIYLIDISNIWQWVLMAIVTTIVATALTFIFDFLIYKKELTILFVKFKGIFNSKERSFFQWLSTK